MGKNEAVINVILASGIPLEYIRFICEDDNCRTFIEKVEHWGDLVCFKCQKCGKEVMFHLSQQEVGDK